MTPSPTVLALGAEGESAGLVVPELARRGARVRGFVRQPENAEKVRAAGATEIAIGDLTDRTSLEEALQGVDSVFYIAPAFIPNEAEIGKDLVEMAQQTGVRRIVFSSVIDPVLSALANHAAKAPVEEAIVTSGLEYTLLQPTLFFQNFARGWPEMVKTGKYAEPWSAETRFTRVDYRDVAEVAAIALTEDRLLFGTFQLCAEGNLNRKEVASLMSEVLGHEIEATNLSPEKRSQISQASGDEQASPMERMFDWYDQHDLLGNPLVLRAILDRAPRTLRGYFEELAGKPQTSGTTGSV